MDFSIFLTKVCEKDKSVSVWHHQARRVITNSEPTDIFVFVYPYLIFFTFLFFILAQLG